MIITRNQSGIPVTVTNRNGSPRPQLASGLTVLTVHYAGAENPVHGRDPVKSFVGLHNWAKNVAKKPYEYNYVITWDGSLFEFAGLFQSAHSKGNNLTSIGVQFHNSVGEPLTDAQVDAYRWLRGHLVEIGALVADHAVTPHHDMRGASTTCPGQWVKQRLAELIAPLGTGQTRIATGADEISGGAQITVDQALAWAATKGAPADIVSEVARLYWELAPALGIRPEVVFAQAMVETANFTFPRCGTTVCPDYCNPCGMRTKVIAAGEGETPQNHQRFPSWRVGVQAHLDHLALYLGRPGYPKPDDQTPDPRHFHFLFGKVVSLTNLGDWWVKGGAGGPHPAYGASVRSRLAAMGAAQIPSEASPPPPPPPPAPLGKDTDVATTQELETIIRTVLNEAVGEGLLDFDDTIKEILDLGRKNFNDLQHLKAEVANLRAA